MAAHSWLYSARTKVVSRWVLASAACLVGSTRCRTRCTVTDVAWVTSEQPAASATAAAEDPAAPAEDEADDVAPAEAADDEPWPAAGAEATTEPHPASAEHSSTASTVPRTWRGDIMRVGRAVRGSRSITSEVWRRVQNSVTGPAPSSFRSSSLRSRPPPYPVRLPSLPMTRWHGTMTEIGLDPLARPTARDATSRLPSARAMEPYVTVLPYGILVSSVQTASWNGDPVGASGTVNSFRSPAKYASSCASTSRKDSGLDVSPSTARDTCRSASIIHRPVSACPSPSSSSLPMGELTMWHRRRASGSV